MPDEALIPTPERLLELIDGMAGQPIPMLVDLVADRFISGEPKRISREAPVLILRYEGESTTPGGGANAVANVAALGGRPLPLGVVGDDDAGHQLLRIFRDREVPTDGILVRPGYRTPTKTRIVAGGRHAIKQQVVRYDIEDRLDLEPEELRRLTAKLATGDAEADIAVISDYGYGAARPSLVSTLRSSLGHSVRILGDSRYRLRSFSGLDGLTPNSEEAEALLGRSFEGDRRALEASGREIREAVDAGFVLITRGSAGMSLFDPHRSAHLPVHGTDQVADVTGAGDTVIGTMALALAAGATPLEAACLANYAGGIVVMKMGTATLDRGELAAAVDTDRSLLERISLHSSTVLSAPTGDR